MAHQTNNTGKKLVWTVAIFSILIMGLTYMLIQENHKRKLVETALIEAQGAYDTKVEELSRCRSQAQSKSIFPLTNPARKIAPYYYPKHTETPTNTNTLDWFSWPW